MATALLDTVENSRIEVDGGVVIKIRGGIVDGLTGDPSTALEQALTATSMPTLGDTVTVTVAGFPKTLIFRRLEVQASQTDRAGVLLIYDNSGLPASAYIIKTRCYMAAFQTYLVPGTNEPLRVDWVNPTDDKDAVPEDSVTFTITQPVKEVSISGMGVGDPPSKYEESVGLCNDDLWRGKNAGFWLVTDAGSELSRYTGWHSWFCTATTRPGRDWSETGTLFNTKVGKYVTVDPADYLGLITDNSYSFGIIAKANGCLRWGPFDTTSFFSLLGF